MMSAHSKIPKMHDKQSNVHLFLTILQDQITEFEKGLLPFKNRPMGSFMLKFNFILKITQYFYLLLSCSFLNAYSFGRYYDISKK